MVAFAQILQHKHAKVCLWIPLDNEYKGGNAAIDTLPYVHLSVVAALRDEQKHDTENKRTINRHESWTADWESIIKYIGFNIVPSTPFCHI